MSELRDLYQEVILDHNKKPRNFCVLEAADRHAEGFNPLCGDRVTVYLDIEDDRVHRIAFQGAGCAISQASASMMTEAIEGKTLGEARELFARFRLLLTEDTSTASEETSKESTNSPVELGKLEAFSGVKDYPMRVKCATLPWHTLRAALDDDGGSKARTE